MEKENLTIYFDNNCGICLKVAKFFRFMDSKHITVSSLSEIESIHIDKEKAQLFIASKSRETMFYGYNWCYAKVRNLSPIGHHI